MTKPKSHPGAETVRPFDLLSAYRAARMKSFCFLALSHTLKDTDAAWNANDAGDEQTEVFATLETQIAETDAQDLKDVFAKLVVLRDGLDRVFKRHEELSDYKNALDSAFEWVEAHALCGAECLPCVKDTAAPLTEVPA